MICIGMNTIKTWTPENIHRMREFVNQKCNATKIAEYMGLTKSAIQSKCYELKLSLNYHGKKIKWSPENISRLIELNDLKKTHTEIASGFGCSVPVISSKLSQLKVRSKNVKSFTDDEKTKLLLLFSEGHTINYIAKIINRSSPFLCRKARELGLISEKSKMITEQLELKKQGNRKCYKCKNIYPYTDEYFRSKSLCRMCGSIHRKGRYQSLMNNLTLNQLLDLRCKQAYQRSCKKGWEFNLSPEYLANIYRKQSGKCFYSGIDMEISLKNEQNSKTLSIDRIDSNKGYTSENVVLCCNIFNVMKMQMSKEEFINSCKIVASYNFS